MIDRRELGHMIKELREKKGMTQLELASLLNLSDRTISKRETGRGYPDITFLERTAALFPLSVDELLSGAGVNNSNVSYNMLKASFYVCPVCGNTIVSTGEGSFSCHGITLEKPGKNAVEDEHSVSVEVVEDEYFISIPHPIDEGVSYLIHRSTPVRQSPDGEALSGGQCRCEDEDERREGDCILFQYRRPLYIASERTLLS